MVEIPPSNARDLGLISGQELTCSGATKPAGHREDQRNQKKKKKKTVKLERGKDYFTEIHLYLFITVNLTEE